MRHADSAIGAWEFDWAVTFSQDMGFLKSGTDVQGLIHTGERTMRYLGCVSPLLLDMTAEADLT